MLLLALIPLYAAADRLFGSDKPAFKGKKAAILTLVTGGGFLIAGVTGALFGLGWFLQRVLPFSDGSQTPREPKEFAKAFVRHAAAMAPALLIAYWRTLSLPHAAIAFAVYVLVACVLAGVYGRELTKVERSSLTPEEGNRRLIKAYGVIEAVRGAAFGAALCWLLSST